MINDKLDLSQSLVYDIGWQVVDLHGNVYEQKSFVIYETFVGMKDVMKSAYYAKKIPMYEEQLKSGERELVRFATMRNKLLETMKIYGTNVVASAHNALFDIRALNNTQRYLTKSKYRFFFPYGTEIWDTLKMARQTYAKEKGYIHFCEDNNYMTNHVVPRPRLTAEILYRYISGDDEFEEEHTGLADVQIESEILWAILRKHKKIDKVVRANKSPSAQKEVA
jgi:DNA polymerase III epsilon subunit-like protein